MTLSLSLALVPGCGDSKSNDRYFDDTDDDAEALTDPETGTESDVTEYEPEEIPPAPVAEEDTGPAYGDVAVPFTEEMGVKLVNVKINGSIGVDMIIDSGCSGTLISLAEAQYLAQKGVLTEDDIMGQQQAQIADGSITLNTVVRLRQLVIGDAILCPDVIATVSDNMNAPLLLGNEVLNRIGAYTVDNENSLLIFHNVPQR